MSIQSHGETHSVSASIAPCSDFSVPYLKTKRPIGLFIFPSLVFAYNATPHSTTGFQPYQLIFGHKVSAPCDAWLGLGVYNDEKSTNKVQWVDQHAEQLLATNKWAMKNIKAAKAKNKRSAGGTSPFSKLW